MVNAKIWRGREKRGLTAAAHRLVMISVFIPAPWRYAIAILVIVAITMVGLWLRPFIYTAPFLFFYPAVFFAVWIGGLRPGILATVLASVLANRFFLPPYDRFSLDIPNLIRTAFFNMTFISVCWLVELARRHLRESEEQFESLANSIPQLAWMANSDGWIFWYNRRWYEYTGTTPSQMEGWGWEMVHDPEMLPKVLERWRTSIKTGQPFDMEFPLRGADGLYRPFLTRVVPVKGVRGEVVQWFGTNTDISDQKRAEEELKRQFSITQAITMTAADAIFLCDPEGRTIFVNPAAKAMLGLTSEELLGKKLHEIVHNSHLNESSHTPSICTLQQVCAKGVTLYDHEEVFFNKKGIPLDGSCSVAPVVEDGKLTASVLVVRDITERKQSEEELGAIYEHAPLIMLVVDGDCRVQKANRFAKQSTEFCNGEILGLRGGEALHCLHSWETPNGCGFGSHCQQCRIRQTILDTFTTGRSHQQVEVRHTLVLSGKVLEATFLISTARLEVRGQYQVLMTMQDITERKQTEESLRESEARFRSICEYAAVGIDQVSSDGRFRMVNAALCRMLGYSESDLLNKTWNEITHPEDVPREARLLDVMLEGKSNSYEIEKRYLHSSGSHVWANETSSPVLDDQGNILYRTAIIQDITDRKHAEKALIRSEKLAAVGKLAGIIAHEINNPLETMTNIVYLLQRSSLDEHAREYLNLFENQLNTLVHITKQTLNLYRETGKPAEFDLSAVIRELLLLFGPKAKKKDVGIVTRLLDESKIVGFGSEIRQVISNLLLNAIEATPVDGRITIHLCGATDWRGFHRRGYRISIADTGVGIDPEHLDHIFEPFFTTKGDKGTGLGLWVSMGIVDRAGGSMRVRSKQSPGRSGTCFSIFLPNQAPPSVLQNQYSYERAISRSA